MGMGLHNKQKSNIGFTEVNTFVVHMALGEA